MTRRLLAPLATMLVVVLSAGPTSAATEVPLRVSEGVEEGRPAMDDGVLAWHQGNRHLDVYVQVSGGQPIKVNPGRSEGVMGDVDGNRLVYSHRPRKWPKKGDADVRMVDISTGARLSLPGKVNSKHEEYAPSLSGDWLMFGRAKVAKRYVDRILLFNLATGEVRRLFKITKIKQLLGMGQVNGQYAAWEWCEPGGPCYVYRYEISTGQTVRAPNPQGLLHYGVGVGDDGVMYFFQSGIGCGADVTLRRWSPAGGDALVHDFPDGVDGHRAYVHDDASSDRHIAYTRVSCTRGEPSDLYEIVV